MTQAPPIRTRPSFLKRWRTLGIIGIRMMFFDRLKLLGTLFGVVFAVVLGNFQVGTFLALLFKNRMFVENAAALTSVFGEWPSFHDAEVISMHLDRTGTQGATLDVRVHAFRMTSDIDARGFYVLTDHTLVALRFADISLLQLRWFNTQNSLSDLLIDPVSPESNKDGRQLPRPVQLQLGSGGRFVL